MLSFLLDEQISPAVAEQAPVKCPGVPIATLYRWREGVFCGQDDDVVLHAARQDGLTLVTYDLKSIPLLLAEWAASGISHAGVVFVDDRTIAPSDFGGLLRALAELWRAEKGAVWKDRILFLWSGLRNH